MLAPDSAPLDSFGIEDGSYIHAVLAAAGVSEGQQGSGRVFGLVHPEGDDDENDSSEENSSDVSSYDDVEIGILPLSSEPQHRGGRQQRREPRGFDRLRQTRGMTRAAIRAIRMYFSRHVNNFIDALPDRPGFRSPHPDESVRDYRMRMEDLWMATQGPASEFQLNVNANNTSALLAGRSNLYNNGEGTFVTGTSSLAGTDRDFMWGFLLGFFIGFVMLFWMWLPGMPHKQKLGIIAGITLQVVFHLLLDGKVESLLDGV
mmetsp:Transcript_8822/g.19429  ORF Transcript_8822/g.19429 Transcript_8822/m.19429 type:complete len:260 (-) Transcript_8822:58-837(-)